MCYNWLLLYCTGLLCASCSEGFAGLSVSGDAAIFGRQVRVFEATVLNYKKLM